MKRLFYSLSATALTCALLVCAEPGLGQGAKQGTIVFIPKSTSATFYLFLVKGAKDRAKELGYTIDYQGPASESEVASQVDLVRNITRSNPAGILLAALDSKGLIPPVEDADKAGVPVVMVDSGIDSDVPKASITTNKILETKPTGMLPRTFEDKDGKRIYFQTWDWSDKSPVYRVRVNLYILCEIDLGWETKSFVTTYRAWRRDEISALMVGAGFDQVRWLFPQETGYYQPVVIARVGNTR
jgi:Periplasmic binding protein domain